jgi:hypothetical protein
VGFNSEEPPAAESTRLTHVHALASQSNRFRRQAQCALLFDPWSVRWHTLSSSAKVAGVVRPWSSERICGLR